MNRTEEDVQFNNRKPKIRHLWLIGAGYLMSSPLLYHKKQDSNVKNTNALLLFLKDSLKYVLYM